MTVAASAVTRWACRTDTPRASACRRTTPRMAAAVAARAKCPRTTRCSRTTLATLARWASRAAIAARRNARAAQCARHWRWMTMVARFSLLESSSRDDKYATKTVMVFSSGTFLLSTSSMRNGMQPRAAARLFTNRKLARSPWMPDLRASRILAAVAGMPDAPALATSSAAVRYMSVRASSSGW